MLCGEEVSWESLLRAVLMQCSLPNGLGVHVQRRMPLLYGAGPRCVCMHLSIPRGVDVVHCTVHCSETHVAVHQLRAVLHFLRTLHEHTLSNYTSEPSNQQRLIYSVFPRPPVATRSITLHLAHPNPSLT